MTEPATHAVIRFESPWFLLLLLALPWLAWLLGKYRSRRSLAFAPLSFLPAGFRRPLGGKGAVLRYWLRFAILAIFILALARPQVPYGSLPDHAKGIDIMLTLDFSKSMDSTDFTWQGKKVSRLEALIEVIKIFMADRKEDRFGIVGFAKFAYLASPLTLDQNWIKGVLENMETGSGTAVGDGMMLATESLEENPDRDKTIILVSDGLSNKGTPPLMAAKYAAGKKIRIYTVRVFPKLISANAFEQNLMCQIARETGGRSYQATDSTALKSIYKEIDKLEAKRVEQRRFQQYQELFPWLLALGALLLLVEIVTRQLLYRRIP